MEATLKPCPFCGGAAGTATKKATFFPSRFKVSCSDSGCGAHFGYWSPSEWNRRAQAAPEAEPVAWQSRFISSGDAWDAWSTCSKEHHDLVKRCPNEWPGYEVRELSSDQQHDAELIELLRGLVAIANKKNRGRTGSPNHGHSVPGVWDSDNGELAGKPCAECAIYDYARAKLATLRHV